MSRFENNDLRDRTKAFALRVIRCVKSLPKNEVGRVIGRQLLRSGTSVAANYRAACRAKSKKDFVYKMTIVEEEVDESLLWMELLVESKTVSRKKLEELKTEASELTAITVSSIKTARSGGRVASR